MDVDASVDVVRQYLSEVRIPAAHDKVRCIRSAALHDVITPIRSTRTSACLRLTRPSLQKASTSTSPHSRHAITCSNQHAQQSIPPQAFGKQYVDLDQARTNQHIYLHQKWTRVPLSPEEEAARREKPTQLAVGGDMGFQVDAKPYSLEKTQALVVLPQGMRIPLPCPQLPELILQSLTAIAVRTDALSAHTNHCFVVDESRL